ncbi:MAG: hypothetical protein AAFX44_05320 [Pseudomonadota bacterium]
MTFGANPRRAILVGLLLLLTGCAGNTELSRYATAQSLQPTSVVGTEVVSFQGIEVRSGDLIASELDSASTLLMMLMAEDYAPYVHAGIIVIDDGKPWVYEAFARLRPTLGPPTGAMSGAIRRQPLDRYLRRPAVTTIVRPPDAAAEAIAEFARQSRKARLEFDPYFDLTSADAVYCTEFVAAALNAAGQSLPPPAARNRNRSLNTALSWLGVDAEAFWLAGDLLAPFEPVALLSPLLSEAQIHARFALKAELHRRFTADQRLGNLFRWTVTGPRVRRHLVELYDDVMAASVEQFSLVDLQRRANAALGEISESATRLAERQRHAPTPSPR